MRIRGKTFRHWEDSQLDCISHEEKLGNGSMIDVQARLSLDRETQLFIGVYTPEGVSVLEIIYDSRPGETPVKAMAWGVAKARGFVALDGSMGAPRRA